MPPTPAERAFRTKHCPKVNGPKCPAYGIIRNGKCMYSDLTRDKTAAKLDSLCALDESYWGSATVEPIWISVTRRKETSP